MAARLLAFLILLIGLPVHAGCDNVRASSGAENVRKEKVKIGPHEFKLELANTTELRTRGFMGRESIPEKGGMLFVFPDAQVRRFWMKNCIVDMDIMFLDTRGRITALHRMKVEPPRREDESEIRYESRLRGYPSRRRAQFAIELKAGWLDKLDLKVGDKIDLDLDRLKRLAR